MLEKNLRQLMGCVDEVAMDANRFLNYQRQYQKQLIQKQQYLQKRVSKHLSLSPSLSPFSLSFLLKLKLLSVFSTQSSYLLILIIF